MLKKIIASRLLLHGFAVLFTWLLVYQNSNRFFLSLVMYLLFLISLDSNFTTIKDLIASFSDRDNKPK